MPLLPDTDSGLDDAAESIDNNSNEYDVCYDVPEYEDTDTGSLGCCKRGSILGGRHTINHQLGLFQRVQKFYVSCTDH